MGKRKRKAPARSKSTPTPQLEVQAGKALEHEQFQKALSLYKELVKREDRPEWREAQRQCYRERARDLLRRGMPEEGVVLLDNLAKLQDDGAALDPELLTLQVTGLIQAGRVQQAAEFYQAHQRELARQPSAARALAARFAAHYLAGDEACMVPLHADDPIRRDAQPALAALHAYTEGNDQYAQTMLGHIPFRSPYRDFVLILKALMHLKHDSERSCALLDKVAQDSPFAAFARDLRPATWDDARALSDTATLDYRQRRLIVGLKGWPEHLSEMLGKLPKADEGRASARARLRFLLDNPGLLPSGPMQEACFALVVQYPEGWKQVQKQLGTLSATERLRLGALEAEHREYRLDAYANWLEFLRQAGDQLPALEKAALYRRIADHDEATNASELECVPSPLSHTEALATSLEWDPDHKPTHSRLIAAYQQSGQSRLYQQSVERALQQFPRDREMLGLAIDAARRKRAFKKAARYAERLLELDPVNRDARQALVDSYLDHARKQVRSGKLDLANKEVVAAERAMGSRIPAAPALILGAVCAHQGGDLKTACQRIQQAEQAQDNSLLTHLMVLVEAHRLVTAPSSVVTDLRGDAQPAVPQSPQSVMAVFHQLRRCANEADEGLNDAIAALQRPLKSAGKLLQDYEDYAAACEALARARAYPLLSVLASQARKHHKATPRFDYYRVYAHVWGEPESISDEILDRIEELEDRARNQGDKRTATLASKLFQEAEDILLRQTDPFGGAAAPVLDELLEMLDQAPPETAARLRDMLEHQGLPMEQALERVIEEIEAGTQGAGPGHAPSAPPKPPRRGKDHRAPPRTNKSDNDRKSKPAAPKPDSDPDAPVQQEWDF